MERGVLNVGHHSRFFIIMIRFLFIGDWGNRHQDQAMSAPCVQLLIKDHHVCLDFFHMKKASPGFPLSISSILMCR